MNGSFIALGFCGAGQPEYQMGRRRAWFCLNSSCPKLIPGFKILASGCARGELIWDPVKIWIIRAGRAPKKECCQQFTWLWQRAQFEGTDPCIASDWQVLFPAPSTFGVQGGFYVQLQLGKLRRTLCTQRHRFFTLSTWKVNYAPSFSKRERESWRKKENISENLWEGLVPRRTWVSCLPYRQPIPMIVDRATLSCVQCKVLHYILWNRKFPNPSFTATHAFWKSNIFEVTDLCSGLLFAHSPCTVYPSAEQTDKGKQHTKYNKHLDQGGPDLEDLQQGEGS